MTSAPTIEEIGASTLNRKWRVEVDTNSDPDAPNWVPVRGRNDFKPTLETKGQDDSTYEGDGWMSETNTARSWGLEFKVLRQTPDGISYDEGQEFLRLLSDELGVEGRAHLRWYEVTNGGPTVEAYRGWATVSWSPDGGGMDGLDSVSVKCTGQGKRFAITHPYANDPAVPALTSVSPGNGAAAGGTLVQIHGSGFLGATAVKFDTTNATSFTVVSESLIVAVSPAHAAANVDVKVTTPAGTSVASAKSKFTYA